MSRIIEAGISAVIRPPRVRYAVDSVPSSISVPGHPDVPRESVHFMNPRGHSIVGSLYLPHDATKCIIYLHGNASCQVEGVFLVPVFGPAGLAVFCFDFAGCGMSEGDTISLGWFERDDVAAAIAILRSQHGIEQFALWGRSMGAATSFFAIAREPTIACAVVDSPFASLSRLVRELAGGFGVPGCLSRLAAWYLKRKVMARAEFDISAVAPISPARQCEVPLFVIHGRDDDFISPEHSRRIFDAYAGAEKVIEIVPGDHGMPRPASVLGSAMLFLARWLGVEIVVEGLIPQIEDAERQIAGLGERMEFYAG
jgi:pimeloyl-ACP methyl ester carboxylesterase